MSSSLPSLRLKEHLTKEKASGVSVIIGVCSLLAFILLGFGSIELYKSNTFVIYQCHVKSIDVAEKRRTFYPYWNITVFDQNGKIGDFIISSFGTTLKKWAWTQARKYKINETYPCYRSGDQTSFIRWDWHWNKPTKLEAYTFIFGGVTLFTVAIGLIVFRRRYPAEFQKIHQQPQQLETSLRSEEQQQSKTVL